MPVVNYDSSVNDKSVVLWSNFLETTGSANIYTNDDPAHPAINALTDSTYDYWQQSGSLNTSIAKVGGGR